MRNGYTAKIVWVSGEHPTFAEISSLEDKGTRRWGDKGKGSPLVSESPPPLVLMIGMYICRFGMLPSVRVGIPSEQSREPDSVGVATDIKFGWIPTLKGEGSRGAGEQGRENIFFPCCFSCPIKETRSLIKITKHGRSLINRRPSTTFTTEDENLWESNVLEICQTLHGNVSVQPRDINHQISLPQETLWCQIGKHHRSMDCVSV